MVIRLFWLRLPSAATGRCGAGQNKLSDLKQAIAEGLDSGVGDMSLDAIWAAAEERSRSADG